jgi:hypothetical protein
MRQNLRGTHRGRRGVPSSAEFRLSITWAMRDQLISSFDSLEPESLVMPALDALLRRPGVYQLYLVDELVYIGKADVSLPRRLTKHHRKLSGRQNIDVADVRFAALYVYEDLKAVAPETLLIEHYRAQGRASWNFNGFGNNDPGQNRDQTVFDSGHFDVQYPIRLDWPCEVAPGGYSVRALLSLLKQQLPYVLRFHRDDILDRTNVSVPAAMSADQLLSLIATSLREADSRWRVIALPGYVIVYPKAGNFPSALKNY